MRLSRRGRLPPGPGRRSSAPRRGFARPRAALAIFSSRAGSPRIPFDLGQQRRRVEGVVFDDLRRARPLHPARVRPLVVGRRVGERDQDRRAPGGGELEDRAARASQDQVAGGEHVAEVRLVLDQLVALLIWSGVEALAQRRVVARPRQVQHAEVAALALGERLDRGEVDRARALAPSDDQQHPLLVADPETRPRRVAVRGQHRLGHRPSRHHVLVAGAVLDRERQADPPRPPGQQPVRQAEVRVGLGQHQRRAGQRRRQPGRPGDVAAAAHHHVGAPPPQRRARRADRADRLEPGPRRAQRVAPVDPAHAEEVDLVARGGNQLRLHLVAGAEEADLGAALT